MGPLPSWFLYYVKKQKTLTWRVSDTALKPEMELHQAAPFLYCDVENILDKHSPFSSSFSLESILYNTFYQNSRRKYQEKSTGTTSFREIPNLVFNTSGLLAWAQKHEGPAAPADYAY